MPARWRREAIAFLLLAALLVAVFTHDYEALKYLAPLASSVVRFCFGMRSRGE